MNNKMIQTGGGNGSLTYLPPCVQVLDIELEQAVLAGGSGNTENLWEDPFEW